MKWKAPATEPSPDCRPLHEVHATAKDDQGHAWSNGEYAARGRDGWDYAWACHPLPAPQPELTRTSVFSRLLHKRTMNMMPPCGGGFRHWGSSYPAAAIRSTAPDDFRQWTGVRQPDYVLPTLKKNFFFPRGRSSLATCPGQSVQGRKDRGPAIPVPCRLPFPVRAGHQKHLPGTTRGLWPFPVRARAPPNGVAHRPRHRSP